MDFSTHFTSINGKLVDTEMVAFGPRLAYRKATSFTPSAHVGVGVVRGSEGFLGNSTAGTHLAVVAGGALDYYARKNLAIRVVQADWVRTTFQSLPRNNVQLSFGVVLRIR